MRNLASVVFLAHLLGLVGVARGQEASAIDAQRTRDFYAFREAHKKALDNLTAKEYDLAIERLNALLAKMDASEAGILHEFVAGRSIDQRARVHYDLACALAPTGKKEAAIYEFTRAIELGNWDWDFFEKDSDLDAIREEEGFKKAVLDGKRAETLANERATVPLRERARKAFWGKPIFEWDFKCKTLAGTTVKRSDFKGKVVVVFLTSTFDPFGKKQLPHMARLHKTYKDQGLEVLGVASYAYKESAETGSELTKKLAREAKVNFPMAAVSPDHLMCTSIPNNHVLPTTLFLCREGKVRLRIGGYQNYETLAALTEECLLAKPPREVEPLQASSSGREP
jgi:hypothetical protein